jgi:hypothetical protein
MINFIKKLFGSKPEAAPTTSADSACCGIAGCTHDAPYKVEAPVAKVEAVNAQPVEKAPEAKAPAKKAPAKKAPAKKPAAIKATAKPKAPKKPKAVKPATK